MFLKKEETGLMVIDVQERLFPHIDRGAEVLTQICYAIDAAKILNFPLIVTEQAPGKLGETVSPIRDRLPEGQVIYPKTTFSGYHDAMIQKAIQATGIKTWVLVGIEAHICILQTAKDLLEAKKNVVVLNDAVSSRSLFDFSTAMGELRDCGVRISSTETIVYECIRDAGTAEFKDLFSLIKVHA